MHLPMLVASVGAIENGGKIVVQAQASHSSLFRRLCASAWTVCRYAFPDPLLGTVFVYRAGRVRGPSSAQNRQMPRAKAARTSPRAGWDCRVPKSGKPMRLQKACTAAAAARWPVRRNTNVANQPNTVVKPN